MGTLYHKPKTPVAQTYYQTPVPTPAPVVTPIDTPDVDSTTDKDRAASALRKRSLPQTILTSFRGVLSQGEWAPQRKSLLGE